MWPEQQARTLAELSRDMDAALQMPGYQMAIAPPIPPEAPVINAVWPDKSNTEEPVRWCA